VLTNFDLDVGGVARCNMLWWTDGYDRNGMETYIWSVEVQSSYN